MNMRFRRARGQKIVRVQVKTPHGSRWISTGCTTVEKAREVCTESMLAKLQRAALANALTPEVICRLTLGRRVTCADVLESWKAESAMDLAPDTLAGYESTLRQWIAEQQLATAVLARVSRQDIFGFINAKGITFGTRRTRRSALMSYYTYAHDHGLVIGNIANTIKVHSRDLVFEQLQPRETKPITREEYDRLMNSPKLTGFWRHATALGYWLGLRIRDVACMEWASIQGETITVFPRKSRRKTPRKIVLPLDDPLIGSGELRGIILDMLGGCVGESPFCFPEQHDIAMDCKRRAALSVYYQRILKSHGITGKRFHGLRHACAMRLKAADRTLDQIGNTLGHASSATTQVYTDHELRS